MSVFSSTVFKSTVFNTGGSVPNTQLSGRNKNLGGYHSWSAHYEHQLLLKTEREEREKIEEIKLLKAEEDFLREKIETLKVKKKPPKTKTKDYNLELVQLLILIEAKNEYLLYLRQRQLIYRRNIALLVIMMACPYKNIQLN